MEGLLVDAKYVGNLSLGRRRGFFGKLQNMARGFNCEVPSMARSVSEGVRTTLARLHAMIDSY
jgi:hypothetical protein